MAVSPLQETLLAEGAELVDGLPVRFAGFEPEYRAVREAAGLLDLSDQGKLVAVGNDRLSFLDAMLSQALAGLPTGSGRHATLLTVQGRVQAEMRVYVRAADVLLETPPESRAPALAGLRRYIISEDVRLRDATEELALLALHGPRARAILAAVAGEFPALAGYDCHETAFAGKPLLIAHAGELGEDGYHLFVPAAEGPALWGALRAAGGAALQPVGREVAEVLRLEAGTPLYGRDFDEQVILTEAGLEDAVSYDKGCYLGQEVIARIKFRGHVNRHLVGLRLEGDARPAEGTPLFAEDREVGRITSAAYSPAAGGVIALGYLRREVAAVGTHVTVQEDGRRRTAEVAERPFVRR